MDPHHRRVDIQSPSDLLYLISNVRAAARQKIDLHLPPISAATGDSNNNNNNNNAEDPLRRKVEELVEQYVVAVFREARKGISVNGMEGEGADGLGAVGLEEGGSSEFEFEPFDSRLADRIRALEAAKEDLNARVADLRRDAPRKAAARYEKALLDDAEAWEKRLAEKRGEVVAGAAESARVDVGGMERWDEVRKMWERGTDGLVGLKGGLTETVARLERAEKVVGYLEGR
ncbi:hypothetical protein K490DRAFT_39348 [Saccharata proteae CBS 121410]|uniref:Kinetochore protein mis14 n=1 Tax=Saccharata proteae CBS 121410 TaxID=1314787 RepID=A0A9P4M011_9PEZI|nr:hypothetical protein K490DRAFT_39348 [Saccharata proteae CBS 121410]